MRVAGRRTRRTQRTTRDRRTSLGLWLVQLAVWGAIPWFGTAVPLPGSPGALPPDPSRPGLINLASGFFNLAYCGSGRRGDPSSHLADLDWATVATTYQITVVQGTDHEYLPFIRTLIQGNPNHRVLFYMHSHGVQDSDDLGGMLNRSEPTFVHATDPASLRVIAAEGLLVDWEADERPLYDELLRDSARDFNVSGYVVYRAEGAGPLVRHSGAIPSTASEFLDGAVAPGARYRYAVRTIGPLDREYVFSGEVEAIARAPGDPPPPPLVHDLQCVVDASPAIKSYPARFRVRVAGPIEHATLRVDRNGDQDFEDEDETLPMRPAGEDWIEISTHLDVSNRDDRGAFVIFGFGYRLEIETGAGRMVLPEHGVYTTSVNNRVRDTNYGFYLTHMDSEPWQEFLLRNLETNAGRGGLVGGVFLDELVFDPVVGVEALPIDLATKEEAAREAAALVAAVRRERPDLAVYYNGLGANVPPAGATGGMIEGFAVGPWHGAPGGAPWIAAPRELRSQVEVARSAIGRGEELLLLARGPELGDIRARLFAFASYLLVRAPGVRFSYMVDRCRQPPLPEWRVDLGEELDQQVVMAQSHGPLPVLSRRFAQGEVWVNGSVDERWPVQLKQPGFLVDLSIEGDDEVGKVIWKPVAGSLVLRPQSAAIIVWQAPPPK